MASRPWRTESVSCRSSHCLLVGNPWPQCQAGTELRHQCATVYGCGKSRRRVRGSFRCEGRQVSPRSSYRERRDTMFETIAWATDGSELADKALEHVRKLA